MTILKCRLIPLVWLFLSSSISIAQKQDPVDGLFQYYFHPFTDKDGLPQNTIRAIARDSQGYLWAGTQDGLARYNGHQWQIQDLPYKQVSNFVNQNAISVASDSSIWFGTRGAGVSVLKKGQWTTYNTENGLPDNRVNHIMETRSESGDREMWIATYGGGIARFSGGQWKQYQNSDGLQDLRIFCLAESHDRYGKKIIWAGHQSGISFYSEGKWNSLSGTHPMNDLIVYHLKSIRLEDKSILWAATSDGVWKYETGEWNRISGCPRHIMLTSLAISLNETQSTILWVGTLGGGLYRLESNRWTHYSSANSLKDDYIFSLFVTEDQAVGQSVWIGTANAGLQRFRPNQWNVLNKKSGLPHHSVTAMLCTEDENGNPAYWFATNGGIMRFSGGRPEIYDKKVLASNRVLCLHESKAVDGLFVIWAGTDNGLMKFENQRWSKYPLPSGMVDSWVYAITETGPGTDPFLWIGTSSGLLRYRRGEWKKYDKSDGMPDNIIKCMTKVQDRLWIGTENGLCYIANDQIRTFSEKDGLPHHHVLSLLPGTENGDSVSLWIGTAGGAAKLSIRGDRYDWEYFNESTDPALPDDQIHQAGKDLYGRIYFGTNSGIVRISPDQSEPGKWISENYTFEDGLPTKECNGRQIISDPYGRLWFGSVEGALIYKPRKPVNTDFSETVIEQISLSGKPADFSDRQVFRHYQNNIRIDFSMFSFHREQETRYHTCLAGPEDSIVGWTKNSYAEYPNLPSGEYVFRVRGKDFTGGDSKAAEFIFTVQTAPWWSWWAWTGYGILAFFAVYGLMRLRMKLLYRKNIQLEKMVDHRTKELRLTQAQLIHSEKMSALGQIAAGIAHEINNPSAFILSNIEFLKSSIKKKKPESVSAEDRENIESLNACETGIRRIHDIVSHLIKFVNLHESDAQTIDLEDTILHTLELFISPQTRIVIQPTITPGLTLNGNPAEFSLALRNILINAVQAIQEAEKKDRHGKYKGLIRIDAALENKEIRISIQDNGTGIQEEIRNKIFDPFFTTREIGAGKGLGLTETYAIIRKHQGEIEVRSVPDQGSEFIIRIPADGTRRS